MTVSFAVAVAAAWLVWPRRHPVVGEPMPGSGSGPASAPASGSRPSARPPARPGDHATDAPASDARAVGIRTTGAHPMDAGGQGRPRAVPVVEVANAIDLLALALRGGAGLLEAVEAVGARLEDPLRSHLLTVAAAQRWGLDSVEAWASVPAAWQPAARALRMAATAGIAPADVLAQASQEIRRAEDQRLEVATARLGVRVVLPLGLLFLPAFVLTTVVPIVMALAAQVLGQP
jgi:hypothetical protein